MKKMKKIKLIALSLFFVTVCVNSTNAAFPTDKDATIEITLNAPTVATVTTTVTKAEVKQELKKINSDKFYSGGSKSKIVAALLAFFLGGLGIHSFYMGNKKKGFIQLGVYIVGIGLIVSGLANVVSGGGASLPVSVIIGYLMILGVGIWALVDFIRILTGGLQPEEGFEN